MRWPPHEALDRGGHPLGSDLMQASALASTRVRSLVSGESIQRLLALRAPVLLLVFFSIVVPPFASANNYIDILTATAVNGVLAVGVTFVIITGGIDLSVGTAMTFASVVMGLASATCGPRPPSCPLCGRPR